jgi:hypothetical protein
VVTGAVVAGALDKTSTPQKSSAEGVCPNCKASVSGKYCSACGQPARVHRSLLSLGHDILHGVFHLEGRIWHTIPELFFKPGRLTRRYIDGERAKFVAPLPLFLFCVFFTFAVFSITSDGAIDSGKKAANEASEEWKRGNANAVAAITKKIDDSRAELSAIPATAERRVELEAEIAELEQARNVLNALTTADWARFAAEAEKEEELKSAETDAEDDGFNFRVVSRDSKLLAGNAKWSAALKEAQENPRLLLYKVKTNTYKFSWALIPISIPFMWLLFFWRRDIHVYDHAVFITYSLSFMMLLLVLIAIAAALGVSGAIWFSVFGIVAPLHLYKQMRQAYAISRAGAGVRLFLLTVFIIIILSLFVSMLFVLGVIA